MNIWISGEVYSDIGEHYRRACLDVEAAIKVEIKNKFFDVPLNSFRCIAIIRDDTVFAEVTKYSKARKSMDFRLAISHAEFKAASTVGQRALVIGMLKRSIQLLKEKIPNCSGLDAFLADVSLVAKQQGWEA